jgi:hypothetical protein
MGYDDVSLSCSRRFERTEYLYFQGSRSPKRFKILIWNINVKIRSNKDLIAKCLSMDQPRFH